MKKFMFSAVAMIAFVGSSRANTAEIEVVEKKEKVVMSLCSDIYHATYISAENNGASQSQASAVAWAAYSTCVAKSLSQNTQP